MYHTLCISVCVRLTCLSRWGIWVCSSCCCSSSMQLWELSSLENWVSVCVRVCMHACVSAPSTERVHAFRLCACVRACASVDTGEIMADCVTCTHFVVLRTLNMAICNRRLKLCFSSSSSSYPQSSSSSSPSSNALLSFSPLQSAQKKTPVKV